MSSGNGAAGNSKITLRLNLAAIASDPCMAGNALMQTATDEDLVRRIAGGDRMALQVLFARHQVKIYRFTLRLIKDEGKAEDIVGDVFLDVWRQADRFEGRSQVSTWLLSIARFKALSALRRRSEVELDEATEASIEDPTDNPDIALQKKDKAAILRRCLETLSIEHREIVDLVYYHEKSVQEAASILVIPEGTVKTRMFHARKKLAELMKSHGIDQGWP